MRYISITALCDKIQFLHSETLNPLPHFTLTYKQAKQTPKQITSTQINKLTQDNDGLNSDKEFHLYFTLYAYGYNLFDIVGRTFVTRWCGTDAVPKSTRKLY